MTGIVSILAADLLEAVSTILWASDKAEVAELKGVKKQFVIK